MSVAKEKYRSLCAVEKTIPVFLNDWWLDAVCGDANWDVALVENNDVIMAALPYAVARRYGFKFMKVPKLTGFLGPWLRYPDDQKYVSRLSFEMDVLKELIAQLPSFDLFRHKFTTSITNWLPFYWKGFEQTTRYTYVLDVSDTNRVFEEFKSSVRGKIRKAGSLVKVITGKPVEDFYRMFSLTFQRQNLAAPASLEYLQRMDKYLADHKQREIFYAVDADNNIHSALYLVWDNQAAYVHLVGEDPALRNSGAGILLVWEAILYTRNVLSLNTFDFLGSMLETVEPVRRSFGARQMPYFQVQKINSPLLRLVYALTGSKLT